MCSERATQNAARHAVLVKGGHLETPPEDEATDLLFDGGGFHIFRAPKIPSRNTHGTGCTLSSAIAALLARGLQLPEAVGHAKRYLSETLRAAPGIGHGAGPLNHSIQFSIGPALDQRCYER
jgi:hydroxymethylpyrimidine/phosphomethylpyrimidine kinase